MIRYFLEECSRRFRPNEIKNFKAGDTFFNEHGDIYNETIASFDSKEEALEAIVVLFAKILMLCVLLK